MTAFDFDKFADAMTASMPDNDSQNTVNKFLSTGFLPLNYAISGHGLDGGLPQGKIIEIFGPESSGKTAIATEVMIATQKAGGFPGFFDHERSFNFALAEKRGLLVDKGHFLFRQPRTFEDSIMESLDTAAKIRKMGLPIDRPLSWVFDSLASMIPMSQLDPKKGITKLGMADQLALSRATSLNFKTMALMAEELNICMVFLNQIRMKPGIMYGDPTTTPGGNAPKFYASVRIQLGAHRIIRGKGDDAVQIGSEISARCVKNKVYRPWMKTKWKFMFRDDGTGYFDNIGSTLDVLIARKALEMKGTRILWDGKAYFRDQLVSKLELDPAESLAKLETMFVDFGLTSGDHDAEGEKFSGVENDDSDDIHVENDE